MKAIQTHCGQYERYGDFFRVWKIETKEENKEKVLQYCFDNLYKRVVPNETEWRENIRYGGEKSNDMNYYFGGYYTLTKNENGYTFTVCEPYAD